MTTSRNVLPWTCCSTDGLLGYVQELAQVYEVVEIFQRQCSINFGNAKPDDKIFGNHGLEHVKRSHFRDIESQSQCVPYDGTAFAILGTKKLFCHYGSDTNAAKKEKANSTRQALADHPGAKIRSVHQRTKKKNCPAMIIIKEVYKFPTYKLEDGDSQYRKKKALANLKADINNDAVEHVKIFYIKLPSVTEHAGHAISAISGVRNPVHPLVINRIREAVDMGFTRVRDVEKLIKMYSDGLVPKPSDFDNAYYPAKEHISNHISRIIRENRKTLTDEGDVQEKVKEWQDMGDSIYYRPKGEQSLLFVEMTAFQRHLLSVYGNGMCHLDATYKTSKYALPLFFVAAKTNNGYKILASFVTENETSVAIHEALQVIKSWVPEWKPSSWMADFSEAEISAIEAVFPGTSPTYICDFHRMQSWSRWLSTKDNGLATQRDDVLALLSKIAQSATESIFTANLTALQTSVFYQNTKFRNYMQRTWLPNKQRWVWFYRRKELLITSTNNGLERQHRIFKENFLDNQKNKSLTAMLTTLMEQFLHTEEHNYIRKNALSHESVGKNYSKPVPAFLHNRPKWFVKHCMDTLYAIGSIDSIEILSNNLFKVSCYKSVDNVDISKGNRPDCTCFNFVRTHLPCVHILGLIASKKVSWFSLPKAYHAHPTFLIDSFALNMNMMLGSPPGPTLEFPTRIDTSLAKLNREKLAYLKEATFLIENQLHQAELMDHLSVLEQKVRSLLSSGEDIPLLPTSENTTESFFENKNTPEREKEGLQPTYEEHGERSNGNETDPEIYAETERQETGNFGDENSLGDEDVRTTAAASVHSSPKSVIDDFCLNLTDMSIDTDTASETLSLYASGKNTQEPEEPQSKSAHGSVKSTRLPEASNTKSAHGSANTKQQQEEPQSKSAHDSVKSTRLPEASKTKSAHGSANTKQQPEEPQSKSAHGSVKTSRLPEASKTKLAHGSAKITQEPEEPQSKSAHGSVKTSRLPEASNTKSAHGSANTKQQQEEPQSKSAHGSVKSTRLPEASKTKSAHGSANTKQQPEEPQSKSAHGSVKTSRLPEASKTKSAHGSAKITQEPEEPQSKSAHGSVKTSRLPEASKTKSAHGSAKITQEPEEPQWKAAHATATGNRNRTSQQPETSKTKSAHASGKGKKRPKVSTVEQESHYPIDETVIKRKKLHPVIELSETDSTSQQPETSKTKSAHASGKGKKRPKVSTIEQESHYPIDDTVIKRKKLHPVIELSETDSSTDNFELPELTLPKRMSRRFKDVDFLQEPTPAPIQPTPSFAVTEEDLAELRSPNATISNFVIDKFAMMKIDRVRQTTGRKIRYIPAEHMMYMKKTGHFLEVEDSSDVHLIVGPLFERERKHWSLLVMRPRNKTHAYVNPMGEPPHDIHGNTILMRAYLKQCNVRDCENISIRHTLQQTTADCGLFVMKFIDDIVHDRDLQDPRHDEPPYLSFDISQTNDLRQTYTDFILGRDVSGRLQEPTLSPDASSGSVRSLRFSLNSNKSPGDPPTAAQLARQKFNKENFLANCVGHVIAVVDDCKPVFDWDLLLLSKENGRLKKEVVDAYLTMKANDQNAKSSKCVKYIAIDKLASYIENPSRIKEYALHDVSLAVGIVCKPGSKYWLTMVLHPKKGQWSLIDPSQESGSSARAYGDLVRKLMTSNDIHKCLYKERIHPISKEGDASLHAIKIADRLLQSKQLTLSSHKDRMEIIQALRDGTDSLENVCTLCGRDDLPRARIIDWIDCDLCGSWFHSVCTTSGPGERHSETVYNCGVCLQTCQSVPENEPTVSPTPVQTSEKDQAFHFCVRGKNTRVCRAPGCTRNFTNSPPPHNIICRRWEQYHYVNANQEMKDGIGWRYYHPDRACLGKVVRSPTFHPLASHVRKCATQVHFDFWMRNGYNIPKQ